MTAAAHPLALPRARRLQQPREFARIRNQGQRMVQGCLIMNWLEAERSRLGVVTSRKVGGAVVRNRARRLLRECFRRHEPTFSRRVEMVLVARRSIAEFRLADVEKDFLKAAGRAGLLQGEV